MEVDGPGRFQDAARAPRALFAICES